MTEDGKKVLVFIKEIRRFSEELTLLLKTADSLMNKKGWITATKNTTYASSSNSLQDAKRWYPFDLFRFYHNSKYPLIVAFVSIILEEDEWMGEPPKTPITEPLVTAGYFVFDDKEDINLSSENYWWARWYELKENRIDDGRIWQEDYKNEATITYEQWNQFDKYWKTEYEDLTIDAFSKILGKDIKIPEGIDTEKDPDKHRKVADEFYEKVKEMKRIDFRSFKCFGYPLILIATPSDVELKIVKPLLDLLSKQS
ncbi:hypothetical protein ig2599ANME_0062 [groundwater metagenome]